MAEDWDKFIQNLHSGKRPAPPPKPKRRPPAPQTKKQTRKVATNVRERIHAEAKVISVDKLTQAGTQFVRVLDPKTLQKILAEAMGAALESHLFLDDDERKEVEGAAQKEFAQLLSEHRQIQEAKSEADRERMKLERQLERLRRGLDAQDARLSKERERQNQRASGEPLRFEPETFEEMERRIRGLIRHMLAQGELTFGGAPDDLNPFAEALRDTVGRVVQDQLQKHVDFEDSQRDEAIDLLERRIAKLSRALDETQGVVQMLATQGAEGSGFSDYTAPRPGVPLSPQSPHYEWKSNVLKRMLDQNIELQSKTEDPRPE